MAVLPIEETLYEWIPIQSLNIGFHVDALTTVMLLVITGVGFLIHIYSIGYMSHDPGRTRYFAYLNLFVFAMLILVLGNNYLMMFIGWEGRWTLFLPINRLLVRTKICHRCRQESFYRQSNR